MRSRHFLVTRRTVDKGTIQIREHICRRWCRKHFAKYLSLDACHFSADFIICMREFGFRQA